MRYRPCDKPLARCCIIIGRGVMTSKFGVPFRSIVQCSDVRKYAGERTTQCQSFVELTGHDSKAIRCGPEFVSGFSCSNRKYLYHTHTCCRPTRTTSEAHKARKTPVQPIFTQDRQQHSESFVVSTHPMWMLQQGAPGLRLFCAE